MSFYSSQSDYQTVQGDKQTIDEQLELPDGTTPDLAGRSVEFVMRHMPSGAKVVSAAATIDDAAAGSVSYTLSPDETGRAGLHHAEWILTGGDDDPTTLPVDEPVNIYIREDVEGDGPVAETLPDDIDGETITPAQVGTPDNPFVGHAGELSVGGGPTITDLVGANLSATDGVLNAVGGDGSGTGSYTDEQARDAVAAMLTAGTNITIGIDDANDTATITSTAGSGGGVTDFEGLNDISSGTLANRPAGGTAGNWYFTTDSNGIYYDNGSGWDTVAELDTNTQLDPATIGAGDLGFDPATQSELESHAGNASAHHDKTTASDLSGANLTVSGGKLDAPADTNTQLSNSEVRAAVDGANVDIAGDAGSVGGYEIQKNGTDGQGIINFKT